MNNAAYGNGRGNVPTMPAKLSNLYGEYYEACCKLAALRQELEQTEQQVKALSKRWGELVHESERELAMAANPPQAVGTEAASKPAYDPKAPMEIDEEAFRRP